MNGLLSDGGILISNVKVANERREIKRKQIESVQRSQLLDDVQHEADEAANKLAAIKSRWSELTDIADPIDLNQRLHCQNERIKSLMQQKDAIIVELERALTTASERYYIDQAKQAADIECLIERIDDQIDVMKNVYLEHLELLHHSIDCEQRMFKAFHTNEWQDLYDERTAAEEQHVESVLQRQQKFYGEIMAIQLHHEEINRDMRIKFDRDNDLVQQKLEDVKADIRLNTKQLNYNHYVLQKRAAENTLLRTKQKNRLIRMRTCSAALRKQAADTRTSHANEMKKQTQNVLSAYGNIGDLELKMRAFAERNDENVRTRANVIQEIYFHIFRKLSIIFVSLKFQHIWQLHSNTANSKLESIWTIDKILHEKHLGRRWQPNISKPMTSGRGNALETAMQSIRSECFDGEKSLLENMDRAILIRTKMEYVCFVLLIRIECG